jgi:hypothetical protein
MNVAITATPSGVGTYNTAGNAYGLTLSGRQVYVADGGFGVAILDTTTVDTPSLVTGMVETNALSVRQSGWVRGDLSLGGGLSVGQDTLISGTLTLSGSASSTRLDMASADMPALVVESGKVSIGTTSLSLLNSTNIPNHSLVIQNGALCVDDNTGSTCASSARSAGTVYAVGAYTQSLDLAETYPTHDSTLRAGELVMVDTESPVYVSRYQKTNASSSPTLLGVVSTKPGLLLGGFDAREGVVSEHSVPLALSGRVPVQVTNENGSIRVGDYIAPSPTHAGFGARASTSGYVVGVALESFDASEGTTTGSVLVFVDIQYRFGQDQVFIDASTGNVGIGTTTPNATLDVHGSISGNSMFIKNDSEILTHDLSGAEALALTQEISVGYYDNDGKRTIGLFASSTSQILSLENSVYDLGTLSLVSVRGTQELSKRMSVFAEAFGISLNEIETVTSDEVSRGVVALVIDALKSFGVIIERGFASFTGLFTEKLTVGSEQAPSGIQLYDEVTGAPYCVRMRNGSLLETSGSCDTKIGETRTPEVPPAPAEDITPAVEVRVPEEVVPSDKNASSTESVIQTEGTVENATPSIETTIPTESTEGVSDSATVAPPQETPPATGENTITP